MSCLRRSTAASRREGGSSSLAASRVTLTFSAASARAIVIAAFQPGTSKALRRRSRTWLDTWSRGRDLRRPEFPDRRLDVAPSRQQAALGLVSARTFQARLRRQSLRNLAGGS